MGNDEVEKPTRSVEVRPINSACNYSILPIEKLFTDLVQGDCSIMFFMGQVACFWGYEGPVSIDVYPVKIDSLAKKSGEGILTRTLEAIKTIHFRNRSDKKEQLKDFGRIIWLLEEYLHRRDHFCPMCSENTPLRFPDIFLFCGKCGSPLEVKEFMPPRFRNKKPIRPN